MPNFHCLRARGARWLALLLAFSALCGGALCGGAQAQEYRLGPRDVLSVTVLRHPELSAEKIEVDRGGRIRLPFVGSVAAAGRTTGEISAQIRRGLLRQLNDPTVTVTVLQTRPQQISVSGAVKNPGLFEIGQNWRISEAIAAAGGLTASPETASATFSRSGGRAVSINLANVLRNSGSSENRQLRAGDSLRIAENTVPVRVAGQVAAPGALEVPRGATVADAVALAGGFVAGAAQRSVTVTRKNGASNAVNLAPGSADRTRVQPGDLIVVDKSNDQVGVLGAVARPGYVALDAGAPLQLAQALANAGGALPSAALTRATLQRADGQTESLDLYALTVLGDQSQNLRLRPGDVVNIPQARGITVSGAVVKPGTYPLEAATAPRVTDALIAAGGLSVPASQALIRIERANSTANSTANSAAAPANFAPPEAPSPRTSAPNASALGTPPINAPRRTIADLMRDGTARNSTTAPTLPPPTVAPPTVAPPTQGASFGGAELPPSAIVGVPSANNAVPTADLIALPGGERRSLAAPRYRANGADSGVLNARVYDGDRITVEVIGPVRVVVSGEVKAEGPVQVEEGTSLVDVIARAGGPTLQASLSNVSIRHADGSSEAVDVGRAFRGGAAPPILLRDGDYVVIPRSERLIYVAGGVRNPGYFAVPEGRDLTLGESLNLAGNSLPGAKLNRIVIIRQTAEGTKRTEYDLQKGGDSLNINVPVRALDVVYVPEATNSPSTLAKITAALAGFSLFR